MVKDMQHYAVVEDVGFQNVIQVCFSSCQYTSTVIPFMNRDQELSKSCPAQPTSSKSIMWLLLHLVAKPFLNNN